MAQKPQTSKEYFSSLGILHLALLAGQVLFLLVSVFLNNSGETAEQPEDLDGSFRLIIPLVVLAGALASIFVTRARLKNLTLVTDLKEKMTGYRTTLIIKYALLEGPSLLAIVGYLLTGNVQYLILAGAIIIAFALTRPTKERAARELQLRPEEKAFLDNPGNTIT